MLKFATNSQRGQKSSFLALLLCAPQYKVINHQLHNIKLYLIITDLKEILEKILLLTLWITASKLLESASVIVRVNQGSETRSL